MKYSSLVVEVDQAELELTLASLSKYDDVDVESASDDVDVLNKLRYPSHLDNAQGHLDGCADAALQRN